MRLQLDFLLAVHIQHFSWYLLVEANRFIVQTVLTIFKNTAVQGVHRPYDLHGLLLLTSCATITRLTSVFVGTFLWVSSGSILWGVSFSFFARRFLLIHIYLTVPPSCLFFVRRFVTMTPMRAERMKLLQFFFLGLCDTLLCSLKVFTNLYIGLEI